MKFSEKRIFRSATLRWTALGLIRSEKIGNAYRTMSSGAFLDEQLCGRLSQRLEDNIKQNYKEKDFENVNRNMIFLVHHLV